MTEYKKHIASNPEIMFGKPCIKGTRIPVDLILEKLGGGQTIEDLLDAYPRITKVDIEACLLFGEDKENHEALKTTIFAHSKRFLADNYEKFLEESLEEA